MRSKHHQYVNRFLYEQKLKSLYKNAWSASASKEAFINAQYLTDREYYNADHNADLTVASGGKGKYRTGTDFMSSSCPKSGWSATRFGGTNGCSSHAKLKHCRDEYQHNKDEANARNYTTDKLAMPYQITKALHYIQDLYTPAHNMSISGSGYVFNQGYTPDSTNSDILGISRPVIQGTYNNGATSGTSITFTNSISTDTLVHQLLENNKLINNGNVIETNGDLFNITYAEVEARVPAMSTYIKNLLGGTIPTTSLYTNSIIRNFMKDNAIAMINAFKSNNMTTLRAKMLDYIAANVVLTYYFAKGSALSKYFD